MTRPKPKPPGRKPSGTAKQPFTCRLSRDVLAYLRSTGNQSEAIADAVRATEAYARWRFGAKLTVLPDTAHFPPEGE